MVNTLARNSRLWLGALALLAGGSLVGCVSDDADPAEEETGGTGGSGASTTGGSGGSTGGTGGTSSGGPPGTACEAFIALPASTPGIADFETYGGQMPLGEWSAPLGGETASGVLTGPFGYGDDEPNDEGQTMPETFAMVPGNDSEYALSIADTEADEYGGGMGLWFSACLDVSGFTGISFWARGIAPKGVAKLSILMNETTSTMPSSGTKKGTCDGTDTGDAPTCVHPTNMFPVTDEWTEIRVPWENFTAGKALTAPIVPDGHNIWQIQFDVELVWVDDGTGVYVPTPAEYELVVDDIAFY
jgi:hypothetical protein